MRISGEGAARKGGRKGMGHPTFANGSPHTLTACYVAWLVGCVAQWLERRSLAGELSLASARSAADV